METQASAPSSHSPCKPPSLLRLSRLIHTKWIHSSGQLPSERRFEALIKHQVCRGKVSPCLLPAACCLVTQLAIGHGHGAHPVSSSCSSCLGLNKPLPFLHLGVSSAVLINIRLSGADCFCLHQLLGLLLLLRLLLLQLRLLHCIPELCMSCGKV